jgi:hypothetical protein
LRAPTAPKGRVRLDGARLKEAALALGVILGIAAAAEYGTTIGRQDGFW